MTQGLDVDGARLERGRDDLWVGTEPIDVARVAAALEDESLGGVALFLGRVRSPNDGQVVSHLDYEGYDAMILATMASLADEARTTYGGTDGRLLVAIHHRLGRVRPGEVSMAVAVAAAHRAAALAACAVVVEEAKRRLPIWKLEVGDGGARYVAGVAVAGEVL